MCRGFFSINRQNNQENDELQFNEKTNKRAKFCFFKAKLLRATVKVADPCCG